MKNNIKDFTWDFRKENKSNIFMGTPLDLISSMYIISSYYLSTHQFYDIEPIKIRYIPLVFKDFLEEDEQIFVNELNNKILFVINNPSDHKLHNKIEYILNILSLTIEKVTVSNNNLELKIRRYDNTDNRRINQRIYYGFD